MELLRTLKTADYFTISNFVAGLLSIFFSLHGNFIVASFLMIAAFIFDSLDGRVARATKKANKFGKELDSLADLTSFGVAPAVFGFSVGLNDLIAIIALAFFATCGLLRLARFNVLEMKDFMGMPITTNGLIFPSIFLVFASFTGYILILYVIMGFLMISDFKIKKL
ncbi:MAG: CDP-diacylglycerol--serine O-phosphatidyltransferase [Bacteroidota bacterium]